MKKIFLVLFLAVAVSCEETYTTENDDLDIEAVVKDNDSLQAFAQCFVDKAECNEVMADFKKDLNEVFQQSCAKCTPAQRHILKRFLEELKKKLPTDYQALITKYDPQSKYTTKLEAAVANA